MIQKDIEINAETIWHLMDAKGAMSIQELRESTSYDMLMIALALGWLAKEHKIKFTTYNEVMYVELAPMSSDMYY